MAEAVLNAQNSLNCAVCLDLLKNAVTIPCGHNYCLECINHFWDQNDQFGVYSCPQCRQTFTPRPVLNKNTMLAELAEGLRNARLQTAASADSYAGPGDVECDICTGRKHKAVKSCQSCETSYCVTHIQSHYNSAALKNHKLMEASMNLKENTCSKHKKLLEIFCRNDQKFICYLCAMNEHNGHKTVSTAAERSEKQKQLMDTQKESQKRICQNEKKIKDLRETMDSLRCSAQAAVDESEKIFMELLLFIERKRSEVKEWIRDHEKAELSLAEALQKKWEQEIADLKKRDTELEQLSHTEDHIYFLQRFKSFYLALPSPASDTTISPLFSTEKLTKAVLDIQEHLKKLRPSEVVKICGDPHQLQQDPKKPYKHFLKWNKKRKAQTPSKTQSTEEETNVQRENQSASVDVSSLCALVLYDYEAADEMEISIKADDILTSIEMTDEGWWHGFNPSGNYGMFPSNYVELI